MKLSSDDRVIEIGDFILTGYCTGFEQGVTALEKISLLFKMSLTPFYPVSGRHLFLLGIGHFASSLLNQFQKYCNDETWQTKRSFLLRNFKYHNHVFADVGKSLENQLALQNDYSF